MEKLIYKGIDETIYYEKLENGMDVYMYPSKNSKNFYMTFNVKYGSMYTEYKINNKKIKTPLGSAHFIEHQLFQEGDHTAFESFAKLGSSVNAFTTYDYTCYEVISTNKFKDNLNLLLDFVENPVFKDKSVSEEKSIIKEEINMYANNPLATLNYGIERNININDKHKDLISGKTSDISNIDSDLLYKIYNTFYHPMNMFIVITGNFKPLEALAIIKENQKKKQFSKFLHPVVIKQKEPSDVLKDYEEKEMNIKIPKIKVAYKFPKKYKSMEGSKFKIILDSFVYLKFGPSSLFNESLKSQNLINYDLIISNSIRDDYFAIYFEFESEYIEEVLELIDNEMSDFKIKEEDIERIKRIQISNLIYSFNDIVAICESMQDDIISNNSINLNVLEQIESLKLGDFHLFNKNLSYKRSIFKVF